MRATGSMFGAAVLIALGAANATLYADTQPAAAPLRARPGVRFDPDKYCPGLAVSDPTDEAPAAVFTLMVGPTGVPSRITLKASSGSTELDTAAAACMPKLRYQPAHSWGDGAAVESAQQIAWKWSRPREHRQSGTSSAATPSVAATADAPGSGRADVRVCLDQRGAVTGDPTLLHSSGDQKFDEAALAIARRGSGSYAPAHAADAGVSGGCVQLSLSPAAP